MNNKINSMTSFKGVMHLSTYTLPDNADEILKKEKEFDPTIDMYDLMLPFDELVITNKEEDKNIIKEVEKTLEGNSSSKRLTKSTSKELFNIFRKITESRNLPICWTKLAAPVITLSKRKNEIIYDDMEVAGQTGNFFGTYIKMDLRKPQEIKESLVKSIKIIKSRDYVSKKMSERLEKIEEDLNNNELTKLEIAKKEYLLLNFPQEEDPNNMPF